MLLKGTDYATAAQVRSWTRSITYSGSGIAEWDDGAPLVHTLHIAAVRYMGCNARHGTTPLPPRTPSPSPSSQSESQTRPGRTLSQEHTPPGTDKGSCQCFVPSAPPRHPPNILVIAVFLHSSLTAPCVGSWKSTGRPRRVRKVRINSLGLPFAHATLDLDYPVPPPP
ncbi:hypothetical protein EsH8_IV_001030 [Colletotrichum jinshuiense]